MITLHTKSSDIIKTDPIYFPGGEVGSRISDITKWEIINQGSVNIRATLQSGRDIIDLLMLHDAIERTCPNSAQHLQIPYAPYARQDRVCNLGEAHGLKVFCDLINNCGFDTVQVCDPHSNVVEALLDRVQIHNLTSLVIHQPEFVLVAKNTILVSPDAGANKKIADLAGCLDHSNFIRADKLRNLATGEIVETIVYADDLAGKSVMIVDDICDGGRTFMELTKALKSKNAKSVSLYITHGIFSKGLKPLFDGGIDQIFTTDSLHPPEGYLPESFHILPLNLTTY